MKLTPSVLGSALLNALIWDAYSDMLIDHQSLINTTRSAANTITTAYINKTARIRANALFMHIENGIFSPLTRLSAVTCWRVLRSARLPLRTGVLQQSLSARRLSAVLMSRGEAAAKQGENQVGSVQSRTHSSHRPLFQKTPSQALESGVFLTRLWIM